MCNGSIMDKLISFSLPLMVSGILQLAFNAVDIIVVGRFSGSQALAAVGSTTALINVFTNLFIGISLGANVLAARFYAAGKDRKLLSGHLQNSKFPDTRDCRNNISDHLDQCRCVQSDHYAYDRPGELHVR